MAARPFGHADDAVSQEPAALVVETFHDDHRRDRLGDRFFDGLHGVGELLVAAGASSEQQLERGLLPRDESEVRAETGMDLLARAGRFRRRLADRVAQSPPDVFKEFEIERAL